MARPTLHLIRRQHAFTLIEVMITVAIVAILAAIAIPNYTAFVMRSKIIDATTKLGDLRTDMEKYFMDNRTYLDGGTCHSAVKLGKIDQYNADPASNFTFDCPAATATTYTLVATGVAAKGMDKFVFTIDETNAKATTSVPSGWSKNALCWITRKDGTCT